MVGLSLQLHASYDLWGLAAVGIFLTQKGVAVKVETMYRMADDQVNYPAGRIGGVPGQDFVRKSDLVDGAYYYGSCRNARCARWTAATGVFTYIRTKFGSRFPEDINHPEDDNGYDLFVPYFRCYPTKDELIPPDEAS